MVPDVFARGHNSHAPCLAVFLNFLRSGSTHRYRPLRPILFFLHADNAKCALIASRMMFNASVSPFVMAFWLSWNFLGANFVELLNTILFAIHKK